MTAFILHLNRLVEEDAELDRHNLPKVVLPWPGAGSVGVAGKKLQIKLWFYWEALIYSASRMKCKGTARRALHGHSTRRQAAKWLVKRRHIFDRRAFEHRATQQSARAANKSALPLAGQRQVKKILPPSGFASTHSWPW